jgi:hypothetical protein
MGNDEGRYANGFRLDWVRDIRDQCARANVPFSFLILDGDAG